MQSKLHFRRKSLPAKLHHHVARVPLGTTMQKTFGREGLCVGTLVGFDDVEDLYKIQYDGGDVEELAWVDFAKLLRVSGDTITVPGAVEPLCVEAPTQISQAAALTLQRSLLTKEVKGVALGKCSTMSRGRVPNKRVNVSHGSTSESDSMFFGGTKISAHTSRRMENIHVAPVRKSPREHPMTNALGDIATQYAQCGSSDGEGAMHAHAKGNKVDTTSDSLSDSDADYTDRNDHDDEDSCSTSDSEPQVLVSETAKGKQATNQKVNMNLHTFIAMESMYFLIFSNFVIQCNSHPIQNRFSLNRINLNRINFVFESDQV